MHKKSWEVRFGDESTNKKRVRFERPFVENLANYVKRHYPERRIIYAYEAGFSGFWAKRALEELGFKTLVITASQENILPRLFIEGSTKLNQLA